MKSKFIYLSIFIFLSFQLMAEKHALIIAIGDYPQEGYWPDISSKNDIHHIKSALLKLGWNKQNITSITDASATYRGITEQLNLLQKRVKEGDIVFIHYSGHGQQVADDNGDELDNLDEALVPYDSPMIFTEGVYEGEKLIRDDQIGMQTKKIREAIGPNGQVILILDSCHSGTGTRGMGKVRGTDHIMASSNFTTNPISGEKTIGLNEEENDRLAPMASYYGASPRELNYETLDDQSKPVGSLSYAMSSVLAQMKNIYTFQELFDRVKLKMKILAPRQNPQWEGPSNVLLLGGTLPPQDESYTISDIINTKKIKAEVGTISDVFSGSTVEIYSKDRNETISRGTVSSALLTESTITLDEDLILLEDELIVLRIKEKAYAGLQVSISIAIDSTSQWNSIIRNISNMAITTEVEENADLYITETNEANSIQIATKEGAILYTHSYINHLAPRLQSDVTKVIRSYIQGNFLKGYNNPKSDHQFDLEIVIVDCNTGIQLETINSQDGKLKIGSCVQFRVTNTGLQGAYFSLIDIQPDNIINLIAPAVDLGYTADEYYLKAGKSYSTNYTIEIAQPSGQETIKLISSKSPLDLSGIISSQGKTTRGVSNRNPFEQLFAETYNVTTRGTKIRKNGEEVGTKTLYFNIVE